MRGSHLLVDCSTRCAIVLPQSLASTLAIPIQAFASGHTYKYVRPICLLCDVPLLVGLAIGCIILHLQQANGMFIPFLRFFLLDFVDAHAKSGQVSAAVEQCAMPLQFGNANLTFMLHLVG